MLMTFNPAINGWAIFNEACRVMAKRLRDVCALPESEPLWKAGRGFVVRDLLWSEEKLRAIPPTEFENWAVIALGGIPNKVQVGDMGVDGRIFPVSSSAAPRKQQEGELGLKERWYPIQVKQKDKVGRPDIDAFEAMMMREDCDKGFFVSFDYSSDALREIESFFKRILSERFKQFKAMLGNRVSHVVKFNWA